MIGGKGQGATGKGQRGNGQGQGRHAAARAAGRRHHRAGAPRDRRRARQHRQVQGAMPRDADFKRPLCADIDGFSQGACTAPWRSADTRPLPGPCVRPLLSCSRTLRRRRPSAASGLRRGCAGPRVGTDALRSGLLAGLLAATVLLTVALCIRWWSLWLLVWLAGSASWRACLADELPPSGVGPSRAGRRSPWLAPYWCSPPACWPGAGAAWATCRRRCPPAGWAEAARAALGQAPAACGSVHGGTLPPR